MSALLTDPPRTAAIFEALDDQAVQVSIDDFGRGQTSPGHLSSLPVHELKIDRSFVWDMIENPSHMAIVPSIVDLGPNLSFRVVAEGVETSRVLDDCAVSAPRRKVFCSVIEESRTHAIPDGVLAVYLLDGYRVVLIRTLNGGRDFREIGP